MLVSLKHNSKDDCWIIIGAAGSEKVFDVTKYLPDHPGGPEIVLDYAGKNADDMFEDIGHSKTAREKLSQYYIGDLKADPSKPKAKASKKEAQAGGGLNPLAVFALLVAIAIGVYFTTRH